MAKRVCIDFDGTLCTYKKKTPFNPSVIEGVPVDGVKEFMEKLKNEGFQIFIHSTRAIPIVGRMAIEDWCKKYEIKYDGITGAKIAAIAYVDDRAVNFSGNFDDAYKKIKELE